MSDSSSPSTRVLALPLHADLGALVVAERRGVQLAELGYHFDRTLGMVDSLRLHHLRETNGSFTRLVDACRRGGAQYRLTTWWSERPDRLRRQLARLESGRRLDQSRGRIGDPEVETAAADAADLAARLARGEEKLFRVGLYLTVYADDRDGLEAASSRVRGLCQSLLLDPQPLTFRALQGWITTLPLGVDFIRLRRSFDTSALAASFPFASGELGRDSGVLYGALLH